ncbi:putative dihydrolipoamide acyltransferase component E2 [Streptomyces ambofaciens ATCC 23877]|uniref:Dihydrolipoamide acetyltransferase component of pyruvate dehydrogenase complex n=1 Tax=Streptomyces ambofaciens (strain ATCC 23877 / 3486 / DSM 40053 / JCM 4204 / NBRC 12836 / NRRL B-2516) TaxID=278992 RepID=A0A0K2AV58_STRA7|nr:dihydrolipoamide acetyltransferase family protein [Streptomyces ambofaciens]AKZ56873.1 putative dihydrolipoamide acyltransferase component E2 [Streptomyces ambofaciens ATCC 23877]
MAQVLEFKLPDLGEGLTEAEIVRWLVEVGDVVAVDQPVVEVETAKAMVEVPCPYGGVVTARFGEEGAELPVGAPLLTVAVGESAADRPARDPGTGGEAAEAARGADTGAGEPKAGESRSEGSGNVLVGYGTSEAPARRRRVRVDRQASPAAGGGANGRDRGADPAAEGPVPVISPLVRRLARQHDLDLRELTGSGPEGLILRADVEYALRAAAAQGGRTAGQEDGTRAAGAGRTPAGLASSASSASSAPVTTVASSASSAARSGGIRTPLRGVRGAVADKLSRSRREIPDATCWVDADATELMRARTAMNAAGGPKISLVALLARICTAALARFPELNSTVDTEAREIVQLDQVHLGFAAQTDRGLVVPVVRDAHARDAEALTSEFARLTEAARAGRLTPGEVTGGTFTLNNYGVFGVDGSTPIVNHPEAAMLGVGRIVPKPWVHEGELAVRQVVQLSLTFDHRVCDGGTAGGFLRYVADCVEQPAVLLRTL